MKKTTANNMSRRRNKEIVGIYSKMLVSRQISVPMANIGKGVKDMLENAVAKSVEGKCTVEGYVKNKSVDIHHYSSGINNGDRVTFHVAFECQVCCPVEGMRIKCIARNITKAGIRATTQEESSPIVVFVARDHHTTMPYFSSVKPDDEIEVKVIGQRFELNDKYISIIAELLEPKNLNKNNTKTRRRSIVIEE